MVRLLALGLGKQVQLTCVAKSFLCGLGQAASLSLRSHTETAEQ